MFNFADVLLGDCTHLDGVVHGVEADWASCHGDVRVGMSVDDGRLVGSGVAVASVSGVGASSGVGAVALVAVVGSIS